MNTTGLIAKRFNATHPNLSNTARTEPTVQWWEIGNTGLDLWWCSCTNRLTSPSGTKGMSNKSTRSTCRCCESPRPDREKTLPVGAVWLKAASGIKQESLENYGWTHICPSAEPGAYALCIGSNKKVIYEYLGKFRKNGDGFEMLAMPLTKEEEIPEGAFWIKYAGDGITLPAKGDVICWHTDQDNDSRVYASRAVCRIGTAVVYLDRTKKDGKQIYLLLERETKADKKEETKEDPTSCSCGKDKAMELGVMDSRDWRHDSKCPKFIPFDIPKCVHNKYLSYYDLIACGVCLEDLYCPACLKCKCGAVNDK